MAEEKKYKKIIAVTDGGDVSKSVFDPKNEDLAKRMEEKNAGAKKEVIKPVANMTSFSTISRVAKTIGYEISIAKKQFIGISEENIKALILNNLKSYFATTDLMLNKNLSMYGSMVAVALPIEVSNTTIIKTFIGKLISTDKINANGDLEVGYVLMKNNYTYDNVSYDIYLKLDAENNQIISFANQAGSGHVFVENVSVSTSSIGVGDETGDIYEYSEDIYEGLTPWHLFKNDEESKADLIDQINMLHTLDDLFDEILPNWLKTRDSFRANKIYGGRIAKLEQAIYSKTGVSGTDTVQNKYVSDATVIGGNDKTMALIQSIKEINKKILTDSLMDTSGSNGTKNIHNQGEHREMRPAKIKILALKVIREMDYTIYFQKVISMMQKKGLLTSKLSFTDLIVTLDIPLNIYETEKEDKPKTKE